MKKKLTPQKSELQKAHILFKEMDFVGAAEHLDNFKTDSVRLRSFLSYVAGVARTEISAGRQANKIFKSPQIKTASEPQKKTKQRLSIAVVLHLFHEEVVELCLEKLDLIKAMFDLIITTPLKPNSTAIQKVLSSYPTANIQYLDNAGRDIGPFIKSWDLIKKYDLCCKIHTKKGVSDFIDPWRTLCLEGLLYSEEAVSAIISKFESDDSLSIAGPEQLYASYNALLGNNRNNVDILTNDFEIELNDNISNGFFMGTMFWMRPSHYGFIDKLKTLEFHPEASQKDGMFEHALERMLGSITLTDKKILLLRSYNLFEKSSKVVSSDYQSTITTFHKHFEQVTRSHQNKAKVVGHIHTGGEYERSISGWLALRDDETPREAIILIDDNFEVDILCKKYRPDLEKHGINKGLHAFQANIPFEYMDGKNHTFKLIDKITGKQVSSIERVKSRNSEIDVIRTLDVWDKGRERLFNSFLGRFSNNDISKKLVTVVMPTFNRMESISSAVNSVLMQSHKNFELIIVDDGSTDRTEQLLAMCYNDPRLLYIKTPNSGVSSARNTGLSKATGEYIFFLDSDNSWEENFLHNMISYMTVTKTDAAYCGMMSYNDLKEITHFKGCDFSWPDCATSNYVDLNTFGLRRHHNERLPEFNCELKRLVDWDFILKIAQYKTISYAPFLGVRYYDGSNSRITNSVNQSAGALSQNIEAIRGQYSGFKRKLNDCNYTFEELSAKAVRLSEYPQATVSTIITAFNHENYIAEAIESVLAQTCSYPHQIIISDDGSTDKTASIIRRYAKKYPSIIKDISSKKNVGISKNMQRCIDATNSNFVAVCEGDDYWTDPNKLAKSIDFMLDNPDHSMVFSQIKIHNTINSKIEHLARQYTLKSESLSAEDFLAEPTMNLIGNFSCCLFNADILRDMPAFMYESRTNEIAVAFYFDNFGKIGFIRDTMSVYRQHSSGVWTGIDQEAKLRSGMVARQMVCKAAAEKYKLRIQKIIAEQYEIPLAKIQRV